MQVCAAIGLITAAGVCSFAILHLPQHLRCFALVVLGLAAFLSPLLINPEHTTLRLVASLAAITVGVKLYDLYRFIETQPPPRFGNFLVYLPNGCRLILRDSKPPSTSQRQTDSKRLVWLGSLSTLAAAVVLGIWRLDWAACPFAAEHCVKVIILCAFIYLASNAGASLWRVIAVPALDFSGPFFTAATPAEFWRRWNMPAGRFIYEYVFLPAGGRRHPFVGVLAAFAFNSLVHEYAFGIAAGKVLGVALAFFLIQGLATAATMRLRPTGWRKAFGILLTLLFNLATSAILFAYVNRFVPFYAARG